MDENQTPQTEGMERKKKLALLIGGCTVGVILTVYLALCIWVGATNMVLPGVSAGGADLGGLTQQQAAREVKAWAADYYDDAEYMLACGGHSRAISGKLVMVDEDEVANRAWQVGRSEPFLKRGAVILAHLFGHGSRISCRPYLDEDGQRELSRALAELDQMVGSPLIETVWSQNGGVLTITRGTTGRMVDREQTQEQLIAAMEQPGVLRVEVPVITAEPEPLDIKQIHGRLYAQAKDAQVDPVTCQATEHVVGVDFDVEQVTQQFEALPQGQTMQAALTVTMPAVTREELNNLLFRDELGRCQTNISGTQNRLSNVITAAKALDGVVLLPGQEFSYNDTLGPRSIENGYLPAPAYIGGKTVDDVGGGICQDSSTLYMAVLRANLKIITRTNHMYTVGYVPDGMDATVVYNAIDFKFCNDTKYPIRIRAQVENRKLTVWLTGTREAPFTVKLTSERLSTTPYEVKYKPDSSVAPGKTVVDTTAYTGCKVRVYRSVYDGEGNLVSRTLENTSNYRHRDKVILYNPADAASLGLVDGQGNVHETVLPVVPEPVPEPVTPAPVPEPEPAVPDPVPEPAPEPVPEPVPEQPVDPVPEQPADPVPAPQPVEQEQPVQEEAA